MGITMMTRQDPHFFFAYSSTEVDLPLAATVLVSSVSDNSRRAWSMDSRVDLVRASTSAGVRPSVLIGGRTRCG